MSGVVEVIGGERGKRLPEKIVTEKIVAGEIVIDGS